MSDAKFVPGLFFKDKHENAPDFVIAKGSIKVADMAAFLAQQGGEYVNFDLKRSRDGKPYASIDDWKPKGGERAAQPERQESERRQPAPVADLGDDFADDDIPF